MLNIEAVASVARQYANLLDALTPRTVDVGSGRKDVWLSENLIGIWPADEADKMVGVLDGLLQPVRKSVVASGLGELAALLGPDSDR